MLPKGGGILMDLVVQQKDIDMPFSLRYVADEQDTIELIFPSIDGNISVIKKKREFCVWIHMKIGESHHFQGYPIWRVQKWDKDTLTICFCSQRNTIFPRDVSIGDFGLAIIKLQNVNEST